MEQEYVTCCKVVVDSSGVVVDVVVVLLGESIHSSMIGSEGPMIPSQSTVLLWSNNLQPYSL